MWDRTLLKKGSPAPTPKTVKKYAYTFLAGKFHEIHEHAGINKAILSIFTPTPFFLFWWNLAI
jgi:hypothetical protein